MDKIIILGDSIAYGKWDKEGGWIARLRKDIDNRYNLNKGGNFQIYNLGIPGEVTTRMVKRAKIEIESRIDNNKKQLVILALGINDSCPNNWMTLQQTPEIEFKKAVSEIITTARQLGCEVGLIGLTPVNPDKSKGLKFTNEEVKKYDQYLSEISKEQQAPKLNLFQDLMQTNYQELLVDSVHPNDKGHEILFEKIKEFLNQNWGI